MRTKTPLTFAVIVMVLFTACSGGKEDIKPVSYDVNISGHVEKGPILSGTEIKLTCVRGYNEVTLAEDKTTVTDNLGSFSFKGSQADTKYIGLSASGTYFNEVTGAVSSKPYELGAYVDITKTSTVNINLLTTIAYNVASFIMVGDGFRERYLIEDASRIAQERVINAFRLDAFGITDLTKLSISNGDDSAAALLAVSSMLLSTRSETSLGQLLTGIRNELGMEGELSPSTKATLLQDARYVATIHDQIEKNVMDYYAKQGKTLTVKNITKYLDLDGDGVAGNESDDYINSITL